MAKILSLLSSAQACELAVTASPNALGKSASSISPRFCSVGEFQRIAGIGRTLIYSLIDEGVIPSVRVRRRRLILVSEALDALSARAGGPNHN